jgi:hypothetical protein
MKKFLTISIFIAIIFLFGMGDYAFGANSVTQPFGTGGSSITQPFNTSGSGGSGSGSLGGSGGSRSVTDFKSFVDLVLSMLGLIVPLLIGCALALFLYGVLVYVINGTDEAKRKEGSKMMMYGIVALFVMVSVWALVALLSETFGFQFGLPALRPGR